MTRPVKHLRGYVMGKDGDNLPVFTEDRLVPKENRDHGDLPKAHFLDGLLHALVGRLLAPSSQQM